MKKILAIMLSVILIVALMPTTIADTFSVSGVFKYTLQDNKATIVGYTEEISGEITIPSAIGEYPVVALANHAFYGCETITKVTVPASVKVIGESAFTDSSLNEIVLNEGLEEIYSMAFGYTAIKKVTLPNSLTFLDYGVFFYCTELTEVKLPNGLTEIPDDSFCFCESLTKIEIPSSVTKIGDYAFGATAITSIDIPSDVTGIGKYAFYEVPLNTVMLPKSVKTVGEYAFYNNTELETIWYTGSESDKASMQIADFNQNFLTATWHYNTCSGEHNYKNVCDATCDDCDWTRIVEGHKYTNNCDTTCNNCGETREVGDHVYDNTCDTDCNECGNVRPIEHTYSNNCDAECNICGHIREVGDHVYDNTCDTDCNECGNVRPIEHTYDDIYDLECNICPHTRSVASIAVTLLPSKITYYKGESLDTNGLQITATLSDGAVGVVTGYTVSDITDTIGEQTVTVTYLGVTTSFKVTIVDYNPGDINGDTLVNNADAIMLRRYLAGWSVKVIEPACDIDKNGIINNRDAIHFARYLAGWEGISI